jgi:two-component system response regulator MprA
MSADQARPQRVLIVDDDVRLVFVMQEVLGDAGYQTRVAADGHAAIQRMSTFAPDVIVLDLMMPHMSGYDVLDWLKRNSLAIPVVVATTDDDSGARDLGAAVKLTKPFTLEQLLDGVALALHPAEAV